MTTADATGGIKVISRAGQILRALAGERQGLSLSELTQRVELPRSTVHRIITALELEGLVAAASPNRGYRLGPELVRMASGEHGELRLELRPIIAELSTAVNETVDLALLIRDQVSFIDQVSAPQRLRAVSAVGSTFPAHCTANGKALLASLDDDTLRKLLPQRLPAFTLNTTTDRDALLEELGQVRVRGYAVDHEEHADGICAVGATVRDALGPIAAISIPVPTQRFDGNEATLAQDLIEACARGSRLLGGY